MMTWSWGLVLDVGWFLFLLIMFSYFWRQRAALLKTQHWKITTGRIESCEWRRDGHQLWPEIQYSYTVGDQKYTGAHLLLDTTHVNPNSAYARQLAYKVADAYKEDKALGVYYDPDNPASAVLARNVPWKLNFIALFFSGLIILHLIVMIKKLFL